MTKNTQIKKKKKKGSSTTSSSTSESDPEEKWKNLHSDVQRIFLILSRDSSYQEGIDSLLNLLTTFKKTKKLPNEKSLIIKESEDLVSCFTGPEILHRFKSQLRQIIYIIQHNEVLREYFSDIRTLLLEAKSEHEVHSKNFKKKTSEIITRGRNIANQLQTKVFKSFLKTSHELIKHFEDDNFIQILRHQADIIHSDITFIDSAGKEQIDFNMLSKLQGVLLPVLADALKYIPIPRITASNSRQEFGVDNIVLCIYDILPENILLHFESDSKLSLRELQVKSSQTHLIIQLDRIIAELKDMEFFFKTKVFPEVADSGRVSVRFKAPGASLKLMFKIVQGKNDTAPRLTQGLAQFKIREMEIKFDKSTLKHDVLLPMLKKMFKKVIKRAIEKQIENNLTHFLTQMADNLTILLESMNKKMIPNIDLARDIIKSSQMGQIFEKRRELIE